MIGLWFVVLLLSLGWYPLTGIYEPADINYHAPLWFSAAALAVSSVLILLLMVKRTRDKNDSNIPLLHYSLLQIIAPVPWRLTVLSISSLVFSLLIPFPYNISGLLLLASTLFAFPDQSVLGKRSTTVLTRISDSFFVCGVILAVQTAILPFFFLFASRFHHADFLAPVMTSLLNIFGAPASFSDGHLNVQIADKIYPFIVSFDGLGLYVSLNILAGAFAFFFLFKSPRKYYLILPVLLLLFMIARYVGVILIFLELEQVNMLWRLDVLTVSLLPLPFILAWLFPEVSLLTLYNSPPPPSAVSPSLNFREENKGGEFKPRGQRSLVWFAISMATLGISFVTFFGFTDPGTNKGGKILLDEGNSNWEWTTQRFDTIWYDQRSTYNYYSMAQYLKYFYHVDQKSEPITKNLLRNYDILFIKTPTKPFSPNELAAIKEFVRRGGGLLLVGDHTNVFGITTNLNPIAERFGMRFRYDAQYDLNGDLSDYSKPKILPDPVVQHMPPFMFETSCMLDVPLMAENSIIGYGIKSVGADYSQANFFPADAGDATNTEFGLFVQAAGVPYGKGRIFLLSDSTPWSNFSMFMPGKPELLLGIMEWLNRENSILGLIHPISALSALLSMIALIVLARRVDRHTIIFVALSVSFLLVPLSTLSLESFNLSTYPAAKPHSHFLKVDFETEHSDIELPVLHLAMNAERAYDTFYIWLQRLNYVPSVKSSYMDALQDGNAVVIINPDKPFRQDEISATKQFLSRGGKLLIMDDSRYAHFAVSNQLLPAFHEQLVSTDTIGLPVLFSKDTANAYPVSSVAAGQVIGGTPILYARMENSIRMPGRPGLEKDAPRIRRPAFGLRFKPAIPPNPALSRRSLLKPSGVATPAAVVLTVGKGVLVTMATSFLFSDRYMGFSSAIPDANMRRIYELEYWIFQKELRLTPKHLSGE